MTAHTAGPWYARGDMVSVGDPKVAPFAEDIPYRPPLSSSIAYPEREANARLIAAAPDLLEAARDADCSCWMEDRSDHGPNCWMPKLRAAIAKATGQEVAQ